MSRWIERLLATIDCRLDRLADVALSGGRSTAPTLIGIVRCLDPEEDGESEVMRTEATIPAVAAVGGSPLRTRGSEK